MRCGNTTLIAIVVLNAGAWTGHCVQRTCVIARTRKATSTQTTCGSKEIIFECVHGRVRHQFVQLSGTNHRVSIVIQVKVYSHIPEPPISVVHFEVARLTTLCTNHDREFILRGCRLRGAEQSIKFECHMTHVIVPKVGNDAHRLLTGADHTLIKAHVILVARTQVDDVTVLRGGGQRQQGEENQRQHESRKHHRRRKGV
mmetsp:Transcript_53337/g.133907  ORF Transcript_53337/g.133907 Transcript_53337/m.133907 type:complete len:200 (+) Transcript_53337:288-887(+)